MKKSKFSSRNVLFMKMKFIPLKNVNIGRGVIIMNRDELPQP